jgi:hypothetical protein
LLNGSSAVTVKLNDVLAVTVPGALTAKCDAPAALTVIVPLTPAMLLVAVSAAESVCVPAVVKVAENVPTPDARVLLPGNTVKLPWSVLVNFTVPVYPAATLLNWSSALTVKVMAVPAVAVPGALTTRCEAAAALTVMVPLTPAMLLVAVSAADSVCAPAVVKVAVNVPTPDSSVLLAGNAVELPVSVLVNFTVPVYPEATLLNWSSALTVNPKPAPAVALLGALTIRCVAAAGLTATVAVPVMPLVTVSVAVNVCVPDVLSVAVNVPTPDVKVALAGTTTPAGSLNVNATVPV